MKSSSRDIRRLESFRSCKELRYHLPGNIFYFVIGVREKLCSTMRIFGLEQVYFEDVSTHSFLNKSLSKQLIYIDSLNEKNRELTLSQ